MKLIRATVCEKWDGKEGMDGWMDGWMEGEGALERDRRREKAVEMKGNDERWIR